MSCHPTAGDTGKDSKWKEEWGAGSNSHWLQLCCLLLLLLSLPPHPLCILALQQHRHHQAGWWDAALLCCERFMCLVNSWNPALPRGLRDFFLFFSSHLSGCATNHWPAFNLLCIFQPSQLGIRFWVGRPAMLNWVPSLLSRLSQWCNSFYCFLLIYLLSACQCCCHLKHDTLRHTMACGS